jgi:hypothetical protein
MSATCVHRVDAAPHIPDLSAIDFTNQPLQVACQCPPVFYWSEGRPQKQNDVKNKPGKKTTEQKKWSFCAFLVKGCSKNMSKTFHKEIEKKKIQQKSIFLGDFFCQHFLAFSAKTPQKYRPKNSDLASKTADRPPLFCFFFGGRQVLPSASDWQGAPKKKGQSRSVAFSGIAICWPILLRLILTPPARHQHPHDTNNPPVGRWGNCEPKWWPQGSSFSSKTKQRSHKAKRGELNGLVSTV